MGYITCVYDHVAPRLLDQYSISDIGEAWIYSRASVFAKSEAHVKPDTHYV